jgi:16S rRNA (uracil1498-N3)-methyltransferase
MRLTRVYVETRLGTQQELVLVGSAANHIMRVLRLRRGDALTVFDGSGGEFGARVIDFRKDAVVVAIDAHRDIDRESPLSLTLAQGVSRGERMDWIIQKATELGATRIAPVLTVRSVVRLDDKQAQRKTQHWRAIAVAACEQCGRNRLPEITTPCAFPDWLTTTASNTTRLLLSPNGESRLDDLKDVGKAITLLIGPEGGLDENEQAAALAAGFTAVRLGPRVLRTETAAIVALTLMQRYFGDL